MKTIRFGVSLPDELIKSFDKSIKKKKYANRSEAIRDLIRGSLIEDKIDENANVLGVLHILYDHHKRELSDKLTRIQHDHHQLIISTTHVHLNHNYCLEVILLKGIVKSLRSISNEIIAVNGVKNGELFLTTSS